MVDAERTKLVVYLTTEERDTLVSVAESEGVNTSDHIRLALGLPMTDWGFRKDELDRRIREIAREEIRKYRLANPPPSLPKHPAE